TAILVVNNVRDIDTDRRAGKHTLAVRLGRGRTRSLYMGLIVAAYGALVGTVTSHGGDWWALLGLLSIPLALRPTRIVLTRPDGPALDRALAGPRARRVQPAGVRRAAARLVASARAARGHRRHPLLAAVSRSLHHGAG